MGDIRAPSTWDLSDFEYASKKLREVGAKERLHDFTGQKQLEELAADAIDELLRRLRLLARAA